MQSYLLLKMLRLNQPIFCFFLFFLIFFFFFLFFFFNDTATTEIYTLSLHDALPIYVCVFVCLFVCLGYKSWVVSVYLVCFGVLVILYKFPRSEEHTSELQSQFRISYAVFCLKKKKKQKQKKQQQQEKEKKKKNNRKSILNKITNTHSHQHPPYSLITKNSSNYQHQPYVNTQHSPPHHHYTQLPH